MDLPFCVRRGRSRRHLAAARPDAPAQRTLARWASALCACLFAVTANNACALYGDKLSFWHMFRSADRPGAASGWGFGEVVESRCDRIAVGERLFGFLPVGGYLVLRRRDFGAGLFDATPGGGCGADLHYFLRRGQSRNRRSRWDDRLFALLYPLFGVIYLLADGHWRLAAHRQQPATHHGGIESRPPVRSSACRHALPAADLLKGLTSPSPRLRQIPRLL